MNQFKELENLITEKRYDDYFLEVIKKCCESIFYSSSLCKEIKLEYTDSFLLFYIEEMYFSIKRLKKKVNVFAYMKGSLKGAYVKYLQKMHSYNDDKYLVSDGLDVVDKYNYRGYVSSYNTVRAVEISSYIKDIPKTIKTIVYKNCRSNDINYKQDCYLSVLFTFYKKRKIYMRKSNDFIWQVDYLYKRVRESLYDELNTMISDENTITQDMLRGMMYAETGRFEDTD
jgi:hypothetical protein